MRYLRLLSAMLMLPVLLAHCSVIDDVGEAAYSEFGRNDEHRKRWCEVSIPLAIVYMDQLKENIIRECEEKNESLPDEEKRDCSRFSRYEYQFYLLFMEEVYAVMIDDNLRRAGSGKDPYIRFGNYMNDMCYRPFVKERNTF